MFFPNSHPFVFLPSPAPPADFRLDPVVAAAVEKVALTLCQRPTFAVSATA